MRSAHSILRRAESTSALTSVLRQCGFSCNGSEVSQLVASGGALNPPAGSRWFAAGDAALHFDPLSSQGLLNALFTGLASAEAASRLLEGADPIRVGDTHLQLIGGIRRAYLSYLGWSYRQERRWPSAPFWARRHSLSNLWGLG